MFRSYFLASEVQEALPRRDLQARRSRCLLCRLSVRHVVPAGIYTSMAIKILRSGADHAQEETSCQTSVCSQYMSSAARTC
jgi:hypothetical protein